MSNFRFGRNTPKEIDDSITNITPLNTKNSRNSIWRQFEKFCGERKYVFDGNTSTEKLAVILKDWGYNMKKVDGNDYKEAVIKTMWNVTAKQLQELYFNKFGIKFDPFVDLEFKGSRNARDAKRRNLQIQPEKRKTSSSILTLEEYNKILKIYNEDTPDGLQKMFFYVAGLELAWRGCEGVNVTIKHFKEESDNCGLPTGRIEYNCIFSKTAQGGSHKLTDSKWLATNTTDPRICPVRLYKKMLSKRGKHITTDRLFLTPNPAWREPSSVGWFKNSPVGRNEMGKWTRTAAEEIGIDIKKKKISNHSLRSTAVSQLAKAGVGEEQLIKITGHANTFSIKPYLQLDGDHHYQMIDKLRANSTAMEESNNKSTNCAPSALVLWKIVFRRRPSYNTSYNKGKPQTLATAKLILSAQSFFRVISDRGAEYETIYIQAVVKVTLRLAKSSLALTSKNSKSSLMTMPVKHSIGGQVGPSERKDEMKHVIKTLKSGVEVAEDVREESVSWPGPVNGLLALEIAICLVLIIRGICASWLGIELYFATQLKDICQG
ncbi:hypothetical protein Zmor_023819 [Zophobas morio]|uniref:Tyr recombinase domain-containing protein n=1 Tax=Zophobas morio TaxID=2755281 RepID=A0AA38M7Q6_9CUCU|nr:hypothetical protein Zmor_023819 [Zophobas morio]